jgi:predicted AAA+ superfamily ATPase
MVKRHLKDIILKHLFNNKAVVIYGARQVGKTTLVDDLIKQPDTWVLVMNGDDADIRELFQSVNAAKLKPIIGNNKVVVVDEAQRITNAGLGIKIIHDNFKDVQLIITGSSSLELTEKIKEPLTGRKFEFFLHPLSFSEMTDHHGFLTEKRLLDHRMIFGYYPDVALNIGNEKRILKTLASDFLYKDILSIGKIKKPVLLDKILKALALQIGNEVSYNELAQLLDYDKETIEKYIDLLEKVYVIFKLPGLNRNLRNEIKKGRKIYFWDNGIRNAVLGNFLPPDSRSDKGALWENFMISERFKLISNNDEIPVSYFWRTTQQQEIDYIEEFQNKFYAYEFKWKSTKKPFLSKTFSNAYPVSEFQVVTKDNFYEFLKIGI